MERITKPSQTIDDNALHERDFRTLFEQSPDAILISAPEGSILDSNGAACNILGYRREELLAMGTVNLFASQDAARPMSDLAGLGERGLLRGERKFRRKDGSVFMGQLTVARLADGRLLAFVRDLTELDRVRDALRDSEARLRHFLDEAAAAEKSLSTSSTRLRLATEAGKVGMWEWNLLTNKFFFSTECKRQIGHTDDEIGDDFQEWCGRIHDADRKPTLDAINDYLREDGTTYEREFRFRHKNGSYRHILSRGTKIPGSDGKAVRMIGTHVDITERLEMQSQLLHAQRIESLGRLASGIAHDFNNILSIINGSAELALDRVDGDDPVAIELRHILQAGERAASLTRQLLAFGRKQIVDPELIDLNRLLADMRSVIQRLLGETIELVLVPADKLSAIRADVGQVEQVIMNLIMNAQDAMPAGGRLTLATRNVETGAAAAPPNLMPPPGRYVALSVGDTGTGIDEETLSRIFEPFFTTKARGKGTGLGLSTVHGIVQQCGGGISVTSHPGRGTAFEVFWPCGHSSADDAATAPSPAPARGSETVLLVEDEPPLQRLARRMLEAAGYIVLVAGNGREAIEIVTQRNEPIDLMLVDWVLPGMSAWDVVDECLKHRPSTKVLYTSGYTANPVGQTDSLGRPVAFIAKPYGLATLARKVREVLDSP
jgi:PAS domain S-box-containing protein